MLIVKSKYAEADYWDHVESSTGYSDGSTTYIREPKNYRLWTKNPFVYMAYSPLRRDGDGFAVIPSHWKRSATMHTTWLKDKPELDHKLGDLFEYVLGGKYQTSYLLLAGKVYPVVSINTKSDNRQNLYSYEDLLKYRETRNDNDNTQPNVDSGSITFAQQYRECIRTKQTRYTDGGFTYINMIMHSKGNRKVNLATTVDKVAKHIFEKAPHILSEEDVRELHRRFNSPILLIKSDKIVVDPNLKKECLTFKHPWEVYTEVESYLTNQMCMEQPTPIHVSDITKIQKHGFDTKQSFRKRKREESY